MTIALTPFARYQRDLESPDFSPDESQEFAVRKLDDLYHRLLERDHLKVDTLSGFFNHIRSKLGAPAAIAPERGLYFWGGVGRGKTYLMDMFFESLPFEDKMRMHFHRFMRRVHQELTDLQGEKDPLLQVAKRISSEARVICFDEFFVSDITDAMLLAGLFEELFRRGVCLVATSNIEPDNLYRDGLQRARFMPAIALIKLHTEVLNIDGGVDYRLRALEQAQLYHTPIDQHTEQAMFDCFHALAPLGEHEFACVDADQYIEIEGRNIRTCYLADDVVWFDFKALCGGPRSQVDYIEIAKEFHAVLVSDVPQMGAHNEDMARRFILMVDEFYDRNIKLVLSAEVGLFDLYLGGRQSFEFERTKSRLQEMQSHDYLAAAHRA